MKRSWCWRSLRGGLRGGLQAAALVSLLSGCSVADDLFGGSSGPTSTPEPVPGPAAQTATQGAPDAATQPPVASTTYPNLGTVPQQAPQTSSGADRAQITSGLVADNQNAAYSDQPVTAQQTGGTPAPAPITAPDPVPVPAPAADAGSTRAASAPETPAAPGARPTPGS